MDYFKVFLEAYSKHHDRELKLLEGQFSELPSKAVALATQAKAEGSKVVAATKKEIQTPSKKPVYVWSTPDGRVVYTIGNPDGFPKQVENNWEKFVAAFTEEGSSDKGAIQTAPLKLSPEEIAQREAEAEAQRQAALLNSTLQEVPPNDPNSEALKNKFSELLQDQETVEVIGEKAAAGTGISKGKVGWSSAPMVSLLKSLVADMPKLTRSPGTDLFMVENRKVNTKDSLRMSMYVKGLVDASKDSRGEEHDFADICNKFGRTTKGQTIMYLGPNKTNARVFYGGSNNKSLGILLGRACPAIKDDELVSLLESSDEVGGASQIRGTVAEFVPDLWTVAEHVLERGKRSKDNPGGLTKKQMDVAKERMRKAHVRLFTGIRSLNLQNERWLTQARRSAVHEEDAAKYEFIKELFGDRGRLMLALYNVQKASIRLRKPDITMGVGEQTGFGNKQDSFEMWKTEEGATRALETSKVEGRVIGVKASEIFELRKDDLKEYKGMGMIDNDNQILYMTDISYKTLLDYNDALLGGSTDNNTDAFMTKANIIQEKDSRAAKYDLAHNFHRRAFARRDPTAKVEFDEIHRMQHNIKSSIDNLPQEWITKASNGEEVKVAGLAMGVNIAIDELKKTTAYEDFVSLLGDPQALVSLKTRYDDAIDNQNVPEMNVVEKEIKEKLKHMLVMKHLKNSIEGKNIASDLTPSQRRAAEEKAIRARKAASTYAAGLFYMSAASKRDTTTLSISVLKSLNAYTTSQNGEINNVIKSIKDGTDEWTPVVTGNSVSFRHRDNKRRSIKVTYDSSGQGKWSGYQSPGSYQDPNVSNQHTSLDDKRS